MRFYLIFLLTVENGCIGIIVQNSGIFGSIVNFGI